MNTEFYIYRIYLLNTLFNIFEKPYSKSVKASTWSFQNKKHVGCKIWVSIPKMG